MIKVNLKDTINEIQTQKVVKKWMDGLSEGSKLNYLKALAEFVMITELTPQELLTIAYKEEEERVPPWERTIDEWFAKYEEHCIQCNRSKATRNTRTSIIKTFFHMNRITTPSMLSKRRNNNNEFKIKNKRQGLTKETIKMALDGCRRLRLKAIILTQVSSGLSVSDVVKLKIKDFNQGLIQVDEKNEICMFHIKRQKTDKEFTTFISVEAVEMIKKYLEIERPAYIPNDYLFSNHFRNQKITEDILQKDLRALNTLLNNEQEEKGAFRDITSHMFRKFFDTQLTNKGMPEEIREHMMGHVLRDKVRDAYYIANPIELQDIYFKYMEYLTVNPTKTLTIESREYKELKEHYEKDSQEKAAEIENLTQKIERLEKRQDLIDKLQGDQEYHDKVSNMKKAK